MRRCQHYSSFWVFNLIAVLCACILDSVFNHGPAVQRTGWVWVAMPYSHCQSVPLSPLPSPFAFSFHPSLCVTIFSWSLLSLLPRWYGWQLGGQLSQGSWQLLGFSTWGVTGFLTLPVVSNSTSFV